MTVAEYAAKFEEMVKVQNGDLNDQIAHPKPTGRVFTHNGAETLKSKDLIQGKCIISGIPLLVQFDFGAPIHSCLVRVRRNLSFLCLL